MPEKNSMRDSFIWCSWGIVILLAISLIPAGSVIMTSSVHLRTTITTARSYCVFCFGPTR